MKATKRAEAKGKARDLVVVESIEAIESVFGGEPEQAIRALGDGKDGEGVGIDAETVRRGVGRKAEGQNGADKEGTQHLCFRSNFTSVFRKTNRATCLERPTIMNLRRMDSLLQDLRYTFRTLGRDAAFTTFAVLIIGLGIGASTTLFSVVNTLLLRPLPFRDPERLAWVTNYNTGGLSGATTQVGILLDLRARNQSFSDLAGYLAFYGVGDNVLSGKGEPERLSGVPVSENFFPLAGRGAADREVVHALRNANGRVRRW